MSALAAKTPVRIAALVLLGAAGVGTSFVAGRATAGGSPAPQAKPSAPRGTVVVLRERSPRLVQLASPARLPDLRTVHTTTNRPPTTTYTPPTTTYAPPTTTYTPPTTTGTTTIIGGG